MDVCPFLCPSQFCPSGKLWRNDWDRSKSPMDLLRPWALMAPVASPMCCCQSWGHLGVQPGPDNGHSSGSCSVSLCLRIPSCKMLKSLTWRGPVLSFLESSAHTGIKWEWGYFCSDFWDDHMRAPHQWGTPWKWNHVSLSRKMSLFTPLLYWKPLR